MSTPEQIAANRANSQHSTGAKTEAGKTASSQNNFRHGFNARFSLLESENAEEFQALLKDLRIEHQPGTMTERLLVEKMAEHYWLTQRALTLQADWLADEKMFALYLRYQTTNDRAFHACLNALLKLRAEKRKTKIGFESQKRKEAEETRRQSNETRKQELHQWAVLLAEAKVTHQQVLTSGAKLPLMRAAVEEETRALAQKAA